MDRLNLVRVFAIMSSIGGAVLDLNCLVVYQLPDEVVSDVDVLGLSCCHWISCECSNASIVIFKHSCGSIGLMLKLVSIWRRNRTSCAAAQIAVYSTSTIERAIVD